MAGLSKNLRDRVENLLKGVGIDKQAKQYPAQLSGGQMQRVAIARALTNRPKVLFADEPTGDLDSETAKQVMELIKKFHEETKTTIIVITHDQEIAKYAERQIVLEDGVVVHSATRFTTLGLAGIHPSEEFNSQIILPTPSESGCDNVRK